MKRFLCAALAAIFVFADASADEGMWLPQLVRKMNARQMKEAGCEIAPGVIYKASGTSLKNAIVRFGGGCTGEIISDEGLLITNHHCGYASIQKLSSTEHDYLKDGYWAMNRNEELPVEGLTVTFLEYMKDITPDIRKAREKALKAFADSADKESIAAKAEEDAIEALIGQARRKNPDCSVETEVFYNGNMVCLVVTKTFRDIRFVGAPPSSIGKFGGDTDNWMWPRHTGDFSMFRVYADRNNNPADYSSANVPYTPKKYLKISLGGVNEGDYTMIMGFPGRTSRFLTSAELESQTQVNDIMIAARTIRQDIMLEDMTADPKINIQYASKYASSSNGWKKAKGMKIAMEKLGVTERARSQEEEFTAWVSGKTSKRDDRKGKYGDALGKIRQGAEQGVEPGKVFSALVESVYRIELTEMSRAFLVTYRQTVQESGDSTAALRNAHEAVARLYKDYSCTTDKKIAAAMLKFYRENVDSTHYLNLSGADFGTMDIDEYVDSLFTKSIFTSGDKFENALRERGPEAVKEDPATSLTWAVSDVLVELFRERANSEKLLQEGRREYTAGLLEWKKKQPSYPDANLTMRLTYGNVKPYSPKDGVLYKHYTTLGGIMEKEIPEDREFTVPEKLKQLYLDEDFGRYAMEDGRMPVAFISNNDITGGNSGSPVLNARGELIGLAFDGNWESMSSDIMFEPELQRCINVDIRYVLFIIDKFGGAGYLLDEMKIVKN